MKIFFFITLLFPFYTQAQTVDEYIELSTIESDRGNYLRSIDYAKKSN